MRYDLLKLPKLPIASVQSLATKQIIKQFATRFDFVYFGHVDARHDDHQLVRGLTVSGNHSDDNYAVGSFRGHDITIVERHTTLEFPGHGTHSYRWVIMQIDLKRPGFPHIFLDAHHHEAIFYANLFTKSGYLETAMPVFSTYDPLFLQYFKAFARTADFTAVSYTITPEVAAMLAHHFRQFDYELEDDSLRVYASNSVVTLGTLQEMMRVGIWFAAELNKLQER